MNDSNFDDAAGNAPQDSEARLMEMLAVSASHQKAPGIEDEEAVANDEKLSEPEKKELLQKAITMAASNGDVEKVKKILNGKARDFVDLNASDEDGTPPLIYASCFVSMPTEV